MPTLCLSLELILNAINMAFQFITAEDIKVHIRDLFHNQITDEDEALMDSAEKSAIKKMKSMLRHRYDADAIFAATGGDRDELIVEYTVAIYLKRLVQRIKPGKVPVNIDEHAAEALDWLEMVAKGEITPELPAIAEDDEEQDAKSLLWGGARAPKDHYY